MRDTSRKVGAAAAAAAAMLLFGSPTQAQETTPATKPMAMQMDRNAPVIPPVHGYSEGKPILFLHTEASDPGIAKILTEMMGSPVLVVPALADAPESMLAHVYVFENGMQPDGPRGPLGFQPDIFDHPPGSEGYRPLRSIVLVHWTDPASARLLRSAAELRKAIASGEITARKTGIVVNMPFLTWPGGQR